VELQLTQLLIRMVKTTRVCKFAYCRKLCFGASLICISCYLVDDIAYVNCPYIAAPTTLSGTR
jgi:hypothetical protein